MSGWILENDHAWINFKDASPLRGSKHGNGNTSLVRQVLCDMCSGEAKFGKCIILFLIMLVRYLSFLQ